MSQPKALTQIYNAIASAIKDMSNQDAVEFLENISGHVDGLAEAIKEEIEENT